MRTTHNEVMMAETRRFCLSMHFLIAAIFLWSFAGCSGKDPGPVCHPVQGQIIYKGKPLAEGIVFFHPLDSTETSQRPMGVTDKDGHFTMTTIHKGDGAPAGRYAITVELRDLKDNGDGEMVREGRNLLPKKYQRPDTSGLEFTVLEGSNEIPRIVLK